MIDKHTLFGWHKSAWYRENLHQFVELMESHKDLDFFFPNYEKAPWHVQVDFGGGIVMNFWPHQNKAQIQYERSVEGPLEIRRKIKEAILLSHEDVDLIED